MYLLALLSCALLNQSCCIGGDNVTTSRLMDEDVAFLPYSTEFTTTFNYLYSRTGDTLSFAFNRPERFVSDERAGPESCTVKEFDTYKTDATQNSIKISLTMTSKSFGSPSLEYLIQDFTSDIFGRFTFFGCDPSIDEFNFQNCLENIEVDGELFQNVIVLQKNRQSDSDIPRIALMNSENGLIYAALNGTDFIRLVE